MGCGDAEPDGEGFGAGRDEAGVAGKVFLAFILSDLFFADGADSESSVAAAGRTC